MNSPIKELNHSLLTQKEKAKNIASIIFKILLVIVSVLAGSSTVPLMGTYQGVGTFLRNWWRAHLIIIWSTPIIIYLFQKHKDTFDYDKIFSLETLGELMINSLILIVGWSLYIHSADYTLVSHTILIANCGGVLIVVINIICRSPVHKYEVIGTLAVILFSIMLVGDNKSIKTSSQTNIIFGDLLSFLSTPLWAIYYILNVRTLKKLPAMMILYILSMIQSIIIIPILLWFNNINFGLLFSWDPEFGLLGWASPEYFWISVILVGPVSGLIGGGSYIFLLDYFPPHIVASIFLLEPVSGQILGVVLGQDNFPGILTLTATAGIITGLAVSMEGKRILNESPKKDITEIELSNDSLVCQDV